MGRSTLIVALLCCACPSTGGIVIHPQPDGGPICGVGPGDTAQFPPCAAGTRCVNRICTPTCTGGAACPDQMYCEGPAAPEDVCAPVVRGDCLNDAGSTDNGKCPSGQVCFYGYCVSLQNRGDGGYAPCFPNSEPNDACGPDALCYQINIGNGNQNTCVGLPSCSQDGTCPQARYGSVCNDGKNPDGGQLLPGKQRLCLFSYCTRDTDCAATAHCFFGSPGILGRCNYGVAGDPCFTNADCIGSTACVGADGGVLDGGVLGYCQ